jgi:hypothetical protein
MTKLVTLRVVLPTDDEVTTEEVQFALRRALETLPVGRAGDREDGPRMHWSAVDVLRGGDRPATVPRKGRKPNSLGAVP